MADPVRLLLFNLGAVTAMMVALWGVSLWRRDASLVDRVWGLGFALVALLTWLQVGAPGGRPLLLTGLATLWGVRLSLHITWRNWGHGEDFRYRAMREGHGARFGWVSLFTVFGLQALLLFFISLPLQLGQVGPAGHALGWLDAAGVALVGVGLFFEAGGDWQLARFKAQPENRGRVMDRGLWRYTRHPNYFGDAVVWWGFYAIAASTTGGRFTILSPALMTFLLVKVSGVALLEKSLEGRPGYRDYVARTNAFLPWFPKKRAD